MGLDARSIICIILLLLLPYLSRCREGISWQDTTEKKQRFQPEQAGLQLRESLAITTLIDPAALFLIWCFSSSPPSRGIMKPLMFYWMVIYYQHKICRIFKSLLPSYCYNLGRVGSRSLVTTQRNSAKQNQNAMPRLNCSFEFFWLWVWLCVCWVCKPVRDDFREQYDFRAYSNEEWWFGRSSFNMQLQVIPTAGNMSSTFLMELVWLLVVSITYLPDAML